MGACNQITVTVTMSTQNGYLGPDMNGLSKAIEHFGGEGKGGQARLAEAIGVQPMTISHWKRRGIPTDRCKDIERATGGIVTRADLKPEEFGEVLHKAS